MKLAAVFAAATVMASPTVTSVQLPKNLNFYNVEPDGASLLVSGDTVVDGKCAWVLVRQAPLRVASHGTGECSRTSAKTVYPVLTYDHKNFTVWVRIAHRSAKTHRVSEGPIVMTFQQYSDTQLESAYGPGTLWLYDVKTSAGPEVLQISSTTGRVENVVRMPTLYRPFLAADDDGLWLAIAPNGGVDAGSSGPAPIYRVAPGAKTAVLVHRGGRAALWIVAAHQTVWADVLTGKTGAEIWRFDGPAGKARALARAGELNTWAASASTDGSAVWAVRQVVVGHSYASCGSEQVIRIDGATGRQSVAATVATPNAQCYGVIYSAFDDDAFSFLDGSELYRVAV